MELDNNQVIDAMLRLGGSFIKRLAAAYCAADDSNRERIRRAFALEWKYYINLCKWKNENLSADNGITTTKTAREE